MAYRKGDYATAMREWLPLTVQGNADDQFSLGLLYVKGDGVDDYQNAVKWFRLAAGHGNAKAQRFLGAVYENGMGVPSNRVVAYALYNLSAANDPSSSNKAIAKRTDIIKTMSPKEIIAGQTLTRELSKQGNLLKALDQYVKNESL